MTLTCEHCHSEFERKPGPGMMPRYCSPKCGQRHRMGRPGRGEERPITCWFCHFAGNPTIPKSQGVCQVCRALLDDFRDWLLRPERRAA